MHDFIPLDDEKCQKWFEGFISHLNENSNEFKLDPPRLAAIKQAFDTWKSTCQCELDVYRKLSEARQSKQSSRNALENLTNEMVRQLPPDLSDNQKTALRNFDPDAMRMRTTFAEALASQERENLDFRMTSYDIFRPDDPVGWENETAKLIDDLAAFANSRRYQRGPAHILLGVMEIGKDENRKLCFHPLNTPVELGPGFNRAAFDASNSRWQEKATSDVIDKLCEEHLSRPIHVTLDRIRIVTVTSEFPNPMHDDLTKLAQKHPDGIEFGLITVHPVQPWPIHIKMAPPPCRNEDVNKRTFPGSYIVRRASDNRALNAKDTKELVHNVWLACAACGLTFVFCAVSALLIRLAIDLRSKWVEGDAFGYGAVRFAEMFGTWVLVGGFHFLSLFLVKKLGPYLPYREQQIADYFSVAIWTSATFWYAALILMFVPSWGWWAALMLIPPLLFAWLKRGVIRRQLHAIRAKLRAARRGGASP